MNASKQRIAKLIAFLTLWRSTSSIMSKFCSYFPWLFWVASNFLHSYKVTIIHSSLVKLQCSSVWFKSFNQIEYSSHGKIGSGLLSCWVDIHFFTLGRSIDKNDNMESSIADVRPNDDTGCKKKKLTWPQPATWCCQYFDYSGPCYPDQTQCEVNCPWFNLCIFSRQIIKCNKISNNFVLRWLHGSE